MCSVQEALKEVEAAARIDALGDDPQARALLLKSIQRLTLVAETPSETAFRILFQPQVNAAIRLAVEMGLLEAISANGHSPVTASELAKQKHVDELLMVRVMRLLTAVGVCVESGPDQFLANSVTQVLSSPGFSSGVKFLYDSFVPAAGSIVDSFHRIGFQSPGDSTQTPFYFKQNMGVFEWLKVNPSQRQNFDQYMAGRSKVAVRWFDIFLMPEQVSQSQSSVLLVDVGGGLGDNVSAFRKNHASLKGRLVLQDLPETIDSISKESLEGIEAMAYNFFTPQPIQDARYYFFSAICHDWSDDKCVEFLSHTVKAMDSETSSILIKDFVVPETNASFRLAALDFHMMSLVAGIERTESQWRSLLGRCGLEVVKIWRSNGGPDAVIEAKQRV